MGQLPTRWNKSRKLALGLFILCLSVTGAAVAQHVSAPEPQTGTIYGTVVDVNDATIPNASVVLEDPSHDHQSMVTGDNGFFHLDRIKPGVPYNVTVSATGFADWTSQPVTIRPGQALELTGIKLTVATVLTSVNAVSIEEVAREQVNTEEKQRVLGFIPNFYVVYDNNPVPLSSKLKFRLALKATTDPVTFLGAAFLAGIDQAADTPDYQQGAAGYGQRFGAQYAGGVTDIMIGGAILPSLLHQDPRYFYQGTGTKKSRAFHALANPFICRGDSGRRQPNYSALGGYLASGAIANTYYPTSNRGAGLVFSTFSIDVAADMAKAILDEFVLRKLTPSAKNTQ
jgi:hypothetical protein